MTDEERLIQNLKNLIKNKLSELESIYLSNGYKRMFFIDDLKIVLKEEKLI